MKKIVLLMVAAGAGFSAMAQVRGGDNFYASKWVIDLNFPVGVLMQSPTSKMDVNYTDAINAKFSDVKLGSGMSYGADLGFGYFIGKQRKFGIGAGIQYLSQSADATMDNFHVEYKDFDAKGNVYRQGLTATRSIKEELTITSINIPVVLKYKHRFNTRVGISVDAGIVYNLQMQNKWKTDAEFNYEAIYQLAKDGSGGVYTVYDNQPTPATQDLLLTIDQANKHNSIGTTADAFTRWRTQEGYNVALGVKPTNNSGTINYTTGSIGFIFRPTVTYRVANRVHLTLGLVATYQTFENKAADNYRLMDVYGSQKYSSMLNTVSSTTNMMLGLNLGIRYFLGTPKDAQYDGKFDY